MLPSQKPLIFIVGGLLFGDEGKGTTVEYLSNKYQATLVVRYNGGPQAMHHVVMKNNTFHCFSQFGSGSFFPSCRTLLSKYMLISPHTLLREMQCLKNAGVSDIEKKFFIDLNCVIVTPLHKLLIRILETLRGDDKHGTTGMGVGVALDDAYNAFGDDFPKGKLFQEKDKENVCCIQIKDLLNEDLLFKKVQLLFQEKLQLIREILKSFQNNSKKQESLNKEQENENKSKELFSKAQALFLEFVKEHSVDSLTRFYLDFAKYHPQFVNSETIIKNTIEKGDNIVMEGAQGALLDRIHGFYPHITKSIISCENALALLKTLPKDSCEIIKVGVLRIYSTRHGNGPFLAHNNTWPQFISEDHNSSSGWQGNFRIGPFDLVTAKYGVDIFKPDIISLTCVDKLLMAAEKNQEISKIPLVFGYKFTQGVKFNEFENCFLWEKSQNDENIAIKIVKQGDEIAWKNSILTKNLNNMLPVVKFIDEVEKKDLDKKLEKVISEEIERKFNFTKQKTRIGEFIAYIQQQLEIPIKILSFGPTFSDKISLF